MAKGIPSETSRDVSLLDIIVSGVSSWVISKLLDFTWRHVKGRKLLKNTEPMSVPLVLRLYLYIVSVPSTLVSASSHRNVDKLGILRISENMRIQGELLKYSVRNS
jgi:hypothetical protein